MIHKQRDAFEEQRIRGTDSIISQTKWRMLILAITQMPKPSKSKFQAIDFAAWKPVSSELQLQVT